MQNELEPSAGRSILTLSIGCYAAGSVAWMLMSNRLTLPQWLAASGILTVATMLYALHAFPDEWRRPRLLPWTLAIQALLSYVPFAFFGGAWMGVPGFLAATSLLWLNGALGWLCWAGAAAGYCALEQVFSPDSHLVVLTAISTVISSLTLYGLARLRLLLLEGRREALDTARLAVAAERIRIARDMHDLLGYSLSVITLKCELAQRLLDSRPEHALAELSTAASMSRQASVDLRVIARGYRVMRMESETTIARTVLASAGIEVRVSVHYGRIDKRAETVLATVLREGVTNLLRHSRARRCTIDGVADDDRAWLTLCNDGIGETAGAGADQQWGGSGLANLSVRLRELGGGLTTRTTEDGWFHLVVQVPTVAPAARASAGRGYDRRGL